MHWCVLPYAMATLASMHQRHGMHGSSAPQMVVQDELLRTAFFDFVPDWETPCVMLLDAAVGILSLEDCSEQRGVGATRGRGMPAPGLHKRPVKNVSNVTGLPGGHRHRVTGLLEHAPVTRGRLSRIM